ncbi:MAG TPA: LysM peptidoglycan-binding domain-containing protein [Actinomycetota bacterium]|nr:LysM peptidoglycan-binding domain-containing protein [Actinomycetota bacterium]
MNRTRVRWPVVILVSLALSLGFLAGRAFGDAGPGREPAAATYVVRSGDTLWRIARGRVGEAGDPRPLIARIVQVNGLASSALQPGTELVVPSPP